MAKPRKTKNRAGSDRDTIILSSEVQATLVARIKELVDNRSTLTARRERYLVIDKAIQLEDDKRAKRANHNFAQDHRPATLLGHVESAYAFYVNLFASGEPVFKIVGPAGATDVVKQMQLKVNQDSEASAYATVISKSMRDAIKYDECSLVLSWSAKSMPSFDGSQDDGSAKLKANRVEGNDLLYVSPYNTFYDENVSHYERHTKGSHTGYFERLSLTELHQSLANWASVGKSIMNIDDCFKANTSQGTVRYYRPAFGDRGNGSDTGLSSLWGDYVAGGIQNSQKYSEFSEHYERCTIWMRLIPSMYGIPVSDSNSVQIFKFVVINMQTLVLAERVTNVMQQFEMITGQLNDDNIQQLSKSMAELLMPTQNLATEVADVRLALLYKAAGDKGIYDSRIISKTDIESRNPSAKIPAKPSATGRSLSEAYLPMRFDASAVGIIDSLQRTLVQDAADITGQNNASRGQFQKGNKTMREYEDVMSNSDAIKYAKAILLENSFFTPIKNAIRNNILQYMQAGEVRAGGESVKVDPVALREAALSFRVADGLKNVERIANTGQLGQAVQMLMQSAEVASARGIDVFKPLMRYFELLGVDMGDITGEPLNLRAPVAPPADTTADAGGGQA